MKRIFFPLSVAALGMTLSACVTSSQADAPSLGKRAVEGRLDVAVPQPVVAPPGPLPNDLAGRLARWESDAVAAQRAFATERNAAATLVAQARGAAVASEAWVVAQQAISRMVAARAPLTGALADIDRLYVSRSIEEEIDGMPAIYALRERLVEMASGQEAVIAALAASLPGQ
ncbi:hypothetical protein [Sphingopyxis sp. MWB1]|uniref:hypothetical protein n=1 Tax=Sphingopyxis sp. MWB1 TaxID=1537715 RepID=UPI00051A3428|nr:hypothetical protein [Sphingopyxis sp. MWB1]